ncbi:MAG: lamin tail domain-containing protein, partial [Pirellulales bacterium]
MPKRIRSLFATWRRARRWRPADSHQRRTALESLEPRQLLAADVMITELMASNDTTLLDEDGNSPDWIELHNAGSEPIDLLNWSLTDDGGKLDKWVFPSVALEADGTLVVFASGKDRTVGGAPLHTNFKLAAKGEYVALVSATGTVVSEFGPDGADYPEQFKDVSYGVTPEGVRYFVEPTPGAANGPGQIGFVADTQFSVDRGFYDAPFDVAITTETPEATIRYTTDGTLPTETSGIEYTGPITVSGTTTLRAAAFREDFVPTNVDTQTYVFPDEVLRQEGSDLVSANWGHAGPDWEVDPKVLNHPDPESRLVVDDLLTIPTVSLVMNFDEMFGEGGIYIAGEGVERATSVELINPDGSDGFQIDASVQIVGGSSTGRWKSDKLSMRLKFSEEFGSGDLKFPVFGDDATDRFDTLVLDAHLNNAWNYGGSSDAPGQRGRAQYLRDAFTSDLQRATGGYAPNSKFVQLYIDGIYWGMYDLHERPDDNFAASYLGGDNEDYDVIKHNKNRVVQGSNESYLELLDAANEDLGDPAKYRAVEELLDIDDFIDYLLVNYYLGNTDWAHQNWYASRNRVDPEGRWRYHSWDAEKVMHNVLDNVVVRSDEGGPTGIHQATKLLDAGKESERIPTGLITNPEYRLRFADRVRKYFFNDGLMTPAKVAELYQQRLDEIDRAVVGESARWGDNRIRSERTREAPYTRGTEWRAERDRLLGSYFPQRTGIVLEQLQRAGLYPAVDAPQLNQHGGEVSESFGVELTAPEGTIIYTTDGSDPRLVGGQISPDAIEYRGPFRLDASGPVKSRVLLDGEWSALNEADFALLSDLPLRVTEINFNPHDANLVDGLGEEAVDNDQFEFLELMNTGDQLIGLGGVRLDQIDVDGDWQGIDFRFSPQMLAAGERLVIVRSVDAFRSRYGNDVRIALGNDGAGGADGEYGGKLANGGERLTLVDTKGLTIQRFDYGVDGAWPSRTAGHVSSLELLDTSASYDDPDNWRASSEFGGSPSAVGLGADGRIVVNEVLLAADDGGPGQLEFYNTTDNAIDIGHWYVADSVDDFFTSPLPAAILVGADQYRVFDETEFDFALDAFGGGQLWVIEADA